MKHRFTIEHSKILFGKLCAFEHKIDEFKREQDEDIIFDLLDAMDIKENCYCLKPKIGEYPPIVAANNVPPPIEQWATMNGKTLDKKEDSKSLQMKILKMQFDIANKINTNMQAKTTTHPPNQPTILPSNPTTNPTVIRSTTVIINNTTA